MKRHGVLSRLLLLLLALALSGCAAVQGQSPAKTETHLRLRNGTGWDIVALSLCETDANTGYKKNLLVQDYVLRNGAWIDIYYPYQAPTAPDAGTDAELTVMDDWGENSPVLLPEYRMLMVLSDGRYFELSKFPIDDMSEGSLLLEEGVGYLSYLSTSSHQQVSTKGAEHATISMFGKAEVDLSAVLSTAAAQISTAQTSDVDVAPTPRPTLRPAGDLGDEDEEGIDPNEGCLVGGLFY